MGRFLDRYRQGEYQQVWDELLAQGKAIRREPLFTDASAVAHETMRRVRQNIEVLIPRLRTLGYHFGEFWGQDPLPHWRREASSSEENPTFLPFVPPHSEVHQYLEQLEQAVGPLPLSLRVFYVEVGGVNFLGTHPTWAPFIELERLDALYLDPLTAETLDDFLKGYADYQMYSEDWPGTPFTLNLAPDRITSTISAEGLRMAWLSQMPASMARSSMNGSTRPSSTTCGSVSSPVACPCVSG
jgi:hypothetical protein